MIFGQLWGRGRRNVWQLHVKMFVGKNSRMLRNTVLVQLIWQNKFVKLIMEIDNFFLWLLRHYEGRELIVVIVTLRGEGAHRSWCPDGHIRIMECSFVNVIGIIDRFLLSLHHFIIRVIVSCRRIVVSVTEKWTNLWRETDKKDTAFSLRMISPAQVVWGDLFLKSFGLFHLRWTVNLSPTGLFIYR